MRHRRRRLQRQRRGSLVYAAERFGDYRLDHSLAAAGMTVTWRGRRVQFYISELVAERLGLDRVNRWVLSRLPGMILL